MKLQTLDLNSDVLPDVGETADETCGFWKRQFAQTATLQQRTFDWAYGVVIPLVCVVADPFVFKNVGLLGDYRPFAYLLSATSIVAMVAWLLWGDRLRGLAAPLAGLFIAGSFVSLLVGIILLPFSLLGLFFLIGFLGFTPLFSGLVFLRNGVRAIRTSRSSLDGRSVLQAAILTALFAIVVPYVANVRIGHIINEIATGDVATIRRESAKLRYVKPLAHMRPVAQRYYMSTSSEQQSPRMRELIRIHEEITGENIEIKY